MRLVDFARSKIPKPIRITRPELTLLLDALAPQLPPVQARFLNGYLLVASGPHAAEAMGGFRRACARVPSPAADFLQAAAG